MLGIGILIGLVGAAIGIVLGLVGGLLGMGLRLMGVALGLGFHHFGLLLVVAGIIWIVMGTNRGNMPSVRADRNGPAPPQVLPKIR